MSLVNLPSMGTIRAGTYYLFIPLIGLTLNFNAAIIIIILLPVLTTLSSGWRKYPELRTKILISALISLSAGVALSKDLFLGTMALMLITLPICGMIAVQTKKQKGAVNEK